jgi:hypothetical protein
MPKKTHRLSSPDWAIEYARDELANFKRDRPVKLSAYRIKAWIRSLQDAERIITKLGRVVGRKEDHLWNPPPGLRSWPGITCETLRETVEFLRDMLKPGRSINVPVARAVLGLSQEFQKRTGQPHYRQVGEIITEVFGHELPSKEIRNNDVEDWARKTAKRYAKVLATKPAFDRAYKAFARSQIENPFSNPPWVYKSPSQSLPPESLPAEFGHRTFLG